MLYQTFFKPLCDTLFAALLLIVFAPIIGMIAVTIYISMGRPILFTQTRPGLDEHLFTIYKFRTMNNEKDSKGNLLDDAMRLKGIGRIIRSLSLDELPQLWNVFKGDMSFIGPRPLLVEYLPLYNATQKCRHHVKPGITGWAQINGRNAISWNEKFEYDLYYVQHISFALDIKIAFITLQKVVTREGINNEGHATSEKFNGNN